MLKKLAWQVIYTKDISHYLELKINGVLRINFSIKYIKIRA